jgi:hypothetical protein
MEMNATLRLSRSSFGDDPLRLLLFAQGERRLKLRTIVMTLAAFDLRELGKQWAIADEAHDKIFLCGKP